MTVIGHSSGEIAAAYAIGAITLSSACRVAYWRGKLTSNLAKSTTRPGTMISVNLSNMDATEYLALKQLHESLTIACINSPSNVTISGPKEDIERLGTVLVAEGIQSFQVNTGAAYHSPAMRAIEGNYRRHLGDLEPAPSPSGKQGNTVMISTVTGLPVEKRSLALAQYWIDNLVSPVRFSDAVQRMIKLEPEVTRKLGVQNIRPIYDIVELGPHSSLRRPAMDTINAIQGSGRRKVQYLGVLDKMRKDVSTSLEIPARLFIRGYQVDLTTINLAREKQTLPLPCDTPLYPFDDSQRYWHESRMSRNYRLRGGSSQSSILGVRVSDWNPLEPRWRKFVSVEEMPWVADHMVSCFRCMILTHTQDTFSLTICTRSQVNRYSQVPVWYSWPWRLSARIMRSL